MARRGCIVLAVLFVVGVLLVAAMVLVATLVGSDEPEPGPSDDASAEVVAATYVAALNARDTQVVAALRSDGVAPDRATAPVLLEGRTTFRDLEVDLARDDLTGEPVADDALRAYARVQFVLERSWAPFPDVSIPEGPTGWGYVLVRDSTSDPWRVLDEGVG